MEKATLVHFKWLNQTIQQDIHLSDLEDPGVINPLWILSQYTFNKRVVTSTTQSAK